MGFTRLLIQKTHLNRQEREVMVSKNISLPWWEKYTLTVEEASDYFGIGEKVLRRFLNEHKNDDFIIMNGNKVLIKKKVFEKYVDEKMTII